MLLVAHARHLHHVITFIFLKVQTDTFANIADINLAERHLVHAPVVRITSIHILLKKVLVMYVNSVDINLAEHRLVHAQRALTNTMNISETISIIPIISLYVGNRSLIFHHVVN
jgi:hypothetical protein